MFESENFNMYATNAVTVDKIMKYSLTLNKKYHTTDEKELK